MTMLKFKDPCDGCGKFDYCKGSENGKVLCPTCLEQKQEDTNGNQD